MERVQHMNTTMAARLLGVHKTTVQRKINAGCLKAEMLKANQGGGSHGLSNMIPVEEVLKTMTTTPAKNYGLKTSAGKIVEKGTANFCILDEEFNLRETILNGKAVWAAGKGVINHG